MKRKNSRVLLYESRSSFAKKWLAEKRFYNSQDIVLHFQQDIHIETAEVGVPCWHIAVWESSILQLAMNQGRKHGFLRFDSEYPLFFPHMWELHETFWTQQIF